MKLSQLKDMSKDDVLDVLGLAIRPSATSQILRAIGLVGFGALLGAGAALLMAPKTGEELRADLGKKVRSVRRNGAVDSMDELST